MFFNSVVLVQTDADVNAIVRSRQKGENATTIHQKEPEAGAVAISSSASLLRSGSNMDSLHQNLDRPELGETSFEDFIYFLFILFLYTYILLTRRKATEALIHRVGNYPYLLPEMPRYCCPLVIS